MSIFGRQRRFTSPSIPSLEAPLPPVSQLPETSAPELFQVVGPGASQIVTFGGRPSLFTTLSREPSIATVDGFLSPGEIRMLRILAFGRMHRSKVAGKNYRTKSGFQSSVRTSSSTGIAKGKNSIVRKIEARISQLCGLPSEHIEPLTITRYRPGEFYGPHVDWFPSKGRNADFVRKSGGQRVATVLVYLNDPKAGETGAGTFFPKLDLRIEPKKGRALIWQNVDSSQKPLDLTVHEGEPPELGTKFIVTAWVREHPYKRVKR
ncbi:MAG: 2OG-Fe(II) oxygenase [Bdellovibrionales bacterium]|nr:2OG-Fe(II) oxygenase [Bdellovibrionales bacterium]